jgi:hypothetical protein
MSAIGSRRIAKADGARQAQKYGFLALKLS